MITFLFDPWTFAKCRNCAVCFSLPFAPHIPIGQVIVASSPPSPLLFLPIFLRRLILLHCGIKAVQDRIGVDRGQSMRMSGRHDPPGADGSVGCRVPLPES